MSVADDILGYLLVGVCMSCVLYGVTTVQTFMYVQTYREDRLSLKMMVIAIWVMETLQTGFCINFLYMYAARHFGDFVFLGGIYWTGGITIYLGTFIQFFVLCFYVKRVWTLSNGSKGLTAPLVFLVMCRFATAIATSSYSYIYPNWVALKAQTGPLVAVVIGQGSSTLIDVAVAGILIYYLRRGRQGDWKSSDGVASFLTMYIVNTGALTSIFSLTIAITYGVEDNLLFMALTEMQYKLYANAFLGSLNARQHIRAKYNETRTLRYPTISFSNKSELSTADPQTDLEVLQEVVGTNGSVNGTSAASEISSTIPRDDTV
ncbi:hypothetical protein A0H81_14028 [Grifola frondosa]|uniref:DUF6534 domain-containing protein n=1 Tax=Grifola frondosa TaxID=5627 RepID=A0A1C7LN61_GRIFR|nr:hypothetical protein A0H81_14028 [Grifola frondosa]